MALFKRANDADGAVEDRIRAAIAEVGPLLKLETIGIELVEFERESGVAMLRFEGDCPGCEMSARMLRDGIEAHLRTQVPEVREVREA
jgi:Fe-S cluster biogenesis protein NfuA